LKELKRIFLDFFAWVDYKEIVTFDKEIQIENTEMPRNGRGTLIAMIVVGVVALAALVACIFLLVQNHGLRQELADAAAQLEADAATENPEAEGEEDSTNGNQPAYTFDVRDGLDGLFLALRDNAAVNIADLQEVVKDSLIDGAEASVVLRALLPDELIAIADNRYHLFPLRDDLAHHNYKIEQFAVDGNGVLTYRDPGGEVISQKGIDISRYQENIEWNKVAADGVDFAIIRVGYRGSTEGTLVLDPNFHDHLAAALANGIDVGVYFFSQALNEAEAIEEAEFVLNEIDGYDITYPVVIDIEALEAGEPRTQNMTQAEWTAVAAAFCEQVKGAGYTPMIYGNLRTFLLMLDMSQLEEYDKWVSYYRTLIYFPYQHTIWRYTTRGQVNGIYGDVALNIGFKVYR
jgi:GH25 family lysozyme M1 (1,4-beta-N-acetylmuramidase)